MAEGNSANAFMSLFSGQRSASPVESGATLSVPTTVNVSQASMGDAIPFLSSGNMGPYQGLPQTNLGFSSSQYSSHGVFSDGLPYGYIIAGALILFLILKR